MIRLLAALAALLLVCPLAAADPVSVAVMEFASKGGIDQGQMDALSDMLANEIRSLGNYKVIGKSDVRAALQVHEQKALLGCSDESCIAEVGGALGVRWIVIGNISLFGQTYLLNLKIMDVQTVGVANSISRTVKGEQDKLLALLSSATRELFGGAKRQLWPEGETPRPLEKPAAPRPAGDWSSAHDESQPQAEPKRAAPAIQPQAAPAPQPEPAARALEPPLPQEEEPAGAAAGSPPPPQDPDAAAPPRQRVVPPPPVPPPDAGGNMWQPVAPGPPAGDDADREASDHEAGG